MTMFGRSAVSWARRSVDAAIIAALVAAFLVVAAPAAPAEATPTTTCYWYTFGTSSNCDGLYRYQTSCGTGSVVQSARLVRGDGVVTNVVIELRYSWSCATIWAQLVNGFSADPGNSAGCHAKIIRNYDGQYYTEPVDPGLSFAFTKMLYDEGVTSYARGYCDSGVWTASARTGSF